MGHVGIIFLGVLLGSMGMVAMVALKVVALEMRWRVNAVFMEKRETVQEMQARLANLILEKPGYLLPWISCALLGILFAVLIGMLGSEGGTVFIFAVIYGITITVGAVIAHRSYGVIWELEEKQLAAEVIFRYLPIEPLVHRLLATALTQGQGARRQAIEAFKEMVSDEMYFVLIRLQAEPYKAIHVLARSLHVSLRPLLDETKPMSVAGIRLLGSLPDRHKTTLVNALNTRGASVGLQVASKILFSQYHHCQAFPDVYCTACNAWTDQIAFKDAAWLQCKVCKDATDLSSPVRRVVGQIGGSTSTLLEDGTLMLQLWDAAKLRAVAAQVDVLEIIGGQDFDYNWAVNAVLGELRNPHLPDHRPYEIVLLGDPQLDLNTRRLLGRV